MIYDLIKSFGKYFENEKVVLDTYHLQNGIYILFKKDGTHKILNVDKKVDTNTWLYEYIKSRDFYSNYISSNKAIDTIYKEKIDSKEYSMGRKICSNNQYTLFFKNRFVPGLIKEEKETIPINIFLKGIDRYFDSMVVLGKNDKKAKSLLEKIKDNISNEDEIMSTKDLLKEKFLKTIDLLKEQDLSKDIWIKIFLEEDIEKYNRASLKYIYLRIFNKNDKNTIKDNKLYGINNYNFGYTTKDKPFTELKSTSYKVGSMIELKDIKTVRNLYIWLLKNISNKDFVKIPLSYDFKSDLDNKNISGESIYLISVENDNGNAIVKEFECIPYYSSSIREFKCTNCFNTGKILDEIEFTTKNINELESRTSKVWFSNVLRASYYKYKDIVAKMNLLPVWKKKILKEENKIFLNFFHKSKDTYLKQNLDRIAMKICLNTLYDEISEDKTYNTIKSVSLWMAFDEYFGGDFKMIKNEIFEKSKEITLNNEEINSDEMYFFFVGQVVKYLLDKSKASSKSQSMIDSIMHAGTQEKLIDIILRMRDKYSYELRINNERFNNILKQIMLYKTEKDVQSNRKYILAGFLDENLFYIKSKKEESVN